MERPTNSISMGTLTHFYCEVSSLIENNGLQSTIMVEKAFYESIACGFGRNTAWGQINLYQDVCPNKENAALSMKEASSDSF